MLPVLFEILRLLHFEIIRICDVMKFSLYISATKHLVGQCMVVNLTRSIQYGNTYILMVLRWIDTDELTNKTGMRQLEHWSQEDMILDP